MKCLSCKSDLRGQPITDRPGEFYERKVGFEVRGVYDGVLIWGCPDCGHYWPRFPEDHYLHAKSVELIQQWQAPQGSKRWNG